VTRIHFSWLFGILAAVAALAGAAPASAVHGPGGYATLPAFEPATDFVEGLAIDAQGAMYVGVTRGVEAPFTGTVWRMTPAGRLSPLASLDVGEGFLTGIALDASGRVYVAAVTFSDEPAAGVYAVDHGELKLVLRLPAESLPNAIAFHGRDMYVSDSINGVVWVGHCTPNGRECATEIWSDDPLLGPYFGANGLAFWHDDLYVAVSDAGRIVRVPLLPKGGAGTPVVVKETPDLHGADGIAFDVDGNLYATTSLDGPYRLLRLAPDGTLTTIADEADGLGYPASIAFGTQPATRSVLYLADGWTESVFAFDVGVRGLPLP
jgi:sugar lactone lactonase YvrE